jgi:hypothetical protein
MMLTAVSGRDEPARRKKNRWVGGNRAGTAINIVESIRWAAEKMGGKNVSR